MGTGTRAFEMTAYAFGGDQHKAPGGEPRERLEKRSCAPRRAVCNVQAIHRIQREISFKGESGLLYQGTLRAQSRTACQWMRTVTARVIHG